MNTAKSPDTVAAGALEIDQLGSAVTFSPILDTSGENAQEVDPRLVFLLRAAARFELVEAGELCLDEAFDDLMAALCWEGRT